MPIFCTSLSHWNLPNAWYIHNNQMCNCAGVRAENEHLTESVQKLPKELVIPNDQIKLLNSIGQGEHAWIMNLQHLYGVVYVYMPGITVELNI